jgi:hypothetical protein
MSDFVYHNVPLEYMRQPLLYNSNRTIFLTSALLAKSDVLDGISDSGESEDRHPEMRAESLMYFLCGGWEFTLLYCSVEVVDGDGYPEGIGIWVKAMAAWLRGHGLCPPLLDDKETVTWGYEHGLLSKLEPWDKAMKHYRNIKQAARRSAKQ